MIKLMIGGDIVPTESNSLFFCCPEQGKLVDEGIENLLKQADYRIFNLETPLTGSRRRATKFGPSLSAEKECVRGLQELGTDFVTLANNHILDYGEEGLCDTMETLRNAGIEFAGAGRDLFAAAKPFYADVKECRIGIYACAEHEFSIAGEKTPGANPFDPLESLDQIASMKKECDYLVVLYHGGKEFYRYPTPWLKKVCEKCVEKGADLVLCQHSHCIGAMQEYQGATIIYGQGNFLFDRKSDEFWDSGLLIGVELENGRAEVHCYPIIKESGRVRLAGEQEGALLLDGLRQRTSEIEQEENVEKLYSDYANTRRNAYLQAFLGKRARSFGFRLWNRLMGRRLIQRQFSQEDQVRLLNYLECEAHRELIIRFLRNNEIEE
ncbi:MAG: CapA family protein [Butyrivibrio sp.]|nr:CapA family protein [Muribaculum sp.]MCM1551797.1 CapA family protein [Butyrivibrio sp.]